MTVSVQKGLLCGVGGIIGQLLNKDNKVNTVLNKADYEIYTLLLYVRERV